MKEPTQYRRELKEKIVECATKMFVNNGVRSVKMDDIANRLSISKRTLYELYDNKEDLLYAVVKDQHDKEHARYEKVSRSADNVMDIVIAVLRIRMQLIKDVNPLFYSDLVVYPQVKSLILEYREQRRQNSLKFMDRGVSEGFFLPDVDYALVTKIVDIVIYGILIDSYGAVSMREFFHVSVLLFIRSICTKKGLIRLDSFLEELKGESML